MMEGRILLIDINSRQFQWLIIPREEWLFYLGGAGYNSTILYRRTYAGQSPEDPNMPLILGRGNLCGKSLFGNRVTVTTKSALTGYYLDSNAGGRFSSIMTVNNIDQIIIEGRAEKPIYLHIKNNKVKFCDASNIWTWGTFASYDYFKRKHGGGISVAGIGTAGSSKVRFANLVFDCHHHAGRGGVGYSMAVKNLKAIILNSSRFLPKPASAVVKIGKKLLNVAQQHPDWSKFQKAAPFDIIRKNIDNRLISSRNWAQDSISFAQKARLLDLEKAFERIPNDKQCPLCPIGCRLKLKIRLGKFSGEIVNGLEVSTLSNLGINLNIFDLPTLAHFHAIASDYGLDTTELGIVIGLAIDVSQHGKSIGDIPPYYLNWSEPEKVENLIHQIANGTGTGKILGQGAARFLKSQSCIKNLKSYISKNLSVPSSGSIPIPDWTLGLTVSVRGGDHVKHFTFLSRTCQRSAIAQKYSKKVLKTYSTSLKNFDRKGRFVWFHENYTAAINALGLCLYPFAKLFDITHWGALTRIYNITNKLTLKPRDLFLAGERIVQTQRAFNYREGIRREDGSISNSLYKRVSKMLNHPGMLDEYYYYRGYYSSGLPSAARLKVLGLDFLISDLNLQTDNKLEKPRFDLNKLPALDEEKLLKSNLK